MIEGVNIGYLEHAPSSFHGMVVKDDDGFYTILLDPNDTYEQRLRTFRHELKHILNDDFAKLDVQEIEAIAHGKEEKRAL